MWSYTSTTSPEQADVAVAPVGPEQVMAAVRQERAVVRPEQAVAVVRREWAVVRREQAVAVVRREQDLPPGESR